MSPRAALNIETPGIASNGSRQILARPQRDRSLGELAAYLRGVAGQIDFLVANRRLPLAVQSLTTRLAAALNDASPQLEISFEVIVGAVGAHFRIPRDRILSPDRSQRIALARHIAIYLCRELLPARARSFPRIGRYFGRDHSTVLYAHKLVASRVAGNEPFRIELAKLLAGLAPHRPQELSTSHVGQTPFCHPEQHSLNSDTPSFPGKGTGVRCESASKKESGFRCESPCCAEYKDTGR